MDQEDQKFMALEGMHEWAQAASEAIARYRSAVDELRDQHEPRGTLPVPRRMRSEIHLFLISAHKFLEYGDWAGELGFLSAAFLDPIGPYRHQIERLRDKKEHVVEYFRGRGRFADDWTHVDENGSADASSLVGTKIGGRLDYIEVCRAMAEIVAGLPDAYLRQH